MSSRLEIGRITVCRFPSPRSTFRIFFAQNAAGKHRFDGFPIWSMYLWCIRSNEEGFKPIWLLERKVGNRSHHNMSIFVSQIHISDYFAPNAAGKHRLDGFPTSSMYFWYIRSNHGRFKHNLTCWAVGWKSVASQYVDFRPPDPHFGFFSPKMLRENIVLLRDTPPNLMSIQTRILCSANPATTFCVAGPVRSRTGPPRTVWHHRTYSVCWMGGAHRPYSQIGSVN